MNFNWYLLSSQSDWGSKRKKKTSNYIFRYKRNLYNFGTSKSGIYISSGRYETLQNLEFHIQLNDNRQKNIVITQTSQTYRLCIFLKFKILTIFIKIHVWCFEGKQLAYTEYHTKS